MKRANQALRSDVFIAVVALSGALVSARVSASEWYLLARHGECSPISVLKRKLPDMPEVRDPQGFVAYLEAKRLKFTRQSHAGPSGEAVEFQVPEAGLAVLLVPGEYCRSGAARPER